MPWEGQDRLRSYVYSETALYGKVHTICVVCPQTTGTPHFEPLCPAMSVIATSSHQRLVGKAAPGVTGAYDGHSLAWKFSIAFFAGVTIYNALELIIVIFVYFTRYRGVYFWSLLIASVGLIPYALGFSFKFFSTFDGNAKYLPVTLLTFGWWAFVTGSNVVLWSRLHLIVSGEIGDRILKYTKWMIIVDAIIFHVPTTVLTYGSNGNLDTSAFVRSFNIMERLQMTGFL